MKKIRRPAALIILALAAPAAAQDDSIAAIQKLYAQVRDAVALALKAEKEGAGAGLYATEILANSHRAPWRAVGNYQKRTTFWYTDQPEFAEHEDLPPEGVLVRIDVRLEAAALRQSEEFLFDRGRLVFYFLRSQYGDGPARETRLYFRDGRLLRRLESGAAEGEEPEASSVLRTAGGLVKLFLSTF